MTPFLFFILVLTNNLSGGLNAGTEVPNAMFKPASPAQTFSHLDYVPPWKEPAILEGNKDR